MTAYLEDPISANDEKRLVRLNKAIADAGICSRRRADDLILAGKVKINGQTVDSPGLKIDVSQDSLEVEGKKVVFSSKNDQVYLLFHKPVQVVTTASDPQGRQTVFDVLPEWVRRKRLFSVGRLDYFSEGLLLLTNDGDLAHRLTHPSWHAPKRYRVIVREKPTDDALAAIRGGMRLAEGETLAPAKVAVSESEQPRGFVLELELIQGLNRQIRRMCRDLGLTVLRLARVSQGPVELGDLPSGKFRDLTPGEVEALRASVGLSGGLSTSKSHGKEQERPEKPVRPTRPRS